MVILVISSMAVVLYTFNPANCSWFPPCPLHTLTGLNCPGCGSTRALHQLVHGDVLGALRLNPLLVLATPLLGFLIIRRDALATFRPGYVWLLVSVVITFGVVRNIPAYPFTLLAP